MLARKQPVLWSLQCCWSHVAANIYCFLSLVLCNVISYFIKSSRGKKSLFFLYIDIALSSKSTADLTNSFELDCVAR